MTVSTLFNGPKSGGDWAQGPGIGTDARGGVEGGEPPHQVSTIKGTLRALGPKSPKSLQEFTETVNTDPSLLAF